MQIFDIFLLEAVLNGITCVSFVDGKPKFRGTKAFRGADRG